jgi:osmotically inducible protein OsmC
MALSFGLAEQGITNGELETKAVVELEKDGEGFTITKSSLTLSAKVADTSRDDFESAAKEAKENCPISKLLNCDISLSISLFKSL